MILSPQTAGTTEQTWLQHSLTWALKNEPGRCPYQRFDATRGLRKLEQRLVIGVTIPNQPMSRRTADLMLLLCDDGVDREELKALICSAFKDGIGYTIRHLGKIRDSDQQ